MRRRASGVRHRVSGVRRRATGMGHGAWGKGQSKLENPLLGGVPRVAEAGVGFVDTELVRNWELGFRKEIYYLARSAYIQHITDFTVINSGFDVQ